MEQYIRGKGKNNIDYGIADAYEAFKFMNPKSTVDYKTYKNVCTAFNKFLMLEVVCRGSDVNIGRLGSISVRKYKAQPKIGRDGSLLVGGVPIDWKATKEYWDRNPKAKAEKKLIRTLNEHTNGYRYRFFWDKLCCSVRNNRSYSFLPLRKYSRMLADVLKDENTSIDFYIDTTKMSSNVIK